MLSVVQCSIIDGIESLLCAYYRYDKQFSVVNHFLTDPDDVQRMEGWGNLSISQSRGMTILLQDVPPEAAEEESFLGVFVNNDIIEALERQNPLVHLSNQNLDAFSVVVEEVSHFHMICQTIASGLQVSHVDLEFQGEIDKLLLASILLENQTGQPYLLPLARLMFDASTLSMGLAEHYNQANRHAGYFWFEFIRRNQEASLLNRRTRDFFCSLSQEKHLQHKLAAISGFFRAVA